MQHKGVCAVEKFPFHKYKEEDHFACFCRNNVKYWHEKYSNYEKKVFRIITKIGNKNLRAEIFTIGKNKVKLLFDSGITLHL